eukprot:714170-Prymnesium_polylepis.1
MVGREGIRSARTRGEERRENGGHQNETSRADDHHCDAQRHGTQLGTRVLSHVLREVRDTLSNSTQTPTPSQPRYG